MQIFWAFLFTWAELICDLSDDQNNEDGLIAQKPGKFWDINKLPLCGRHIVIQLYVSYLVIG